MAVVTILCLKRFATMNAVDVEVGVSFHVLLQIALVGRHVSTERTGVGPVSQVHYKLRACNSRIVNKT